MQDTQTFLSSLTNSPGVYQMLGEQGEVIYVGKAKNLKKRVTSYFRPNLDVKTHALMKHVKDISIIVTHNESEALILECNLIKKNRPRYNVLFRDDKSYPYILITNEHPYPRIDFYRGQVKKNGLYFGPYPSAAAVRETIHLIQKVFQIRTCEDHFFQSRSRPCLHHQIGLCSGSCTGLISPEEYQQHVKLAILFLEGKNELIIDELKAHMEKAAQEKNYEAAARFRNQISKIREIQEKQYVSSAEGDADVIALISSAGVVCIQLLTIRGGRMLGSRSYTPTSPAEASHEEIVTAFITQHYLSQQVHDIPKQIILESKLADQALLTQALSDQAQRKVTLYANVRGDRKKWLEMATASAQQAVASQLLNKIHTKERFAALQALLELKETPHRIECFDISHTMGEETVASCVAFDSNGPIKNDYRRFNITGITPGDDVAAMHQAIIKRYQRKSTEEKKIPAILLIDGGLAQLHIAEKALAELEITTIRLIGVAKGVTRKPGYETLHMPGHEPLHLSPDSIALHLIQHIRDEAHRFAITGHRRRRDKKRTTSSLETIPGIGAKRRRDLLRHFGGIQGINRASLEDLAKVPGISLSLAQRIFEILHNVSV